MPRETKLREPWPPERVRQERAQQMAREIVGLEEMMYFNGAFTDPAWRTRAMHAIATYLLEKGV